MSLSPFSSVLSPYMKGETEQEETEKEESEKENENGWPRGVGPSGGRDASLVVGDLICNTQALG